MLKGVTITGVQMIRCVRVFEVDGLIVCVFEVGSLSSLLLASV